MIASSVAKSVARSVARAVSVVGSSSATIESQLASAQLYALDGTAPYYGTAISGVEVLRDVNGVYDHPISVEVPCAFVNSTEYLSLGDSDHFSGEIDCSAWLYISTNPITGPIFSKYGAGGLEYSFGFYSGTAYALVYDSVAAGGLVRVSGSVAAYFEQWFHYRVTYTVAAGIKIYIDGVQVDNASENFGTFTQMRPGTQALQLGGSDGGLGAAPLCKISDVRIVNGAVTRYVPLQEGIGSLANNDKSYWYDTDDNYGSLTWTGGTAATRWPGRAPVGQTQDHCINYGGKFGVNGEFVGALPDSTTCFDGGTATRTAGKFGNPYSRLSLNPAGDYAVGRFIPQAVSPGESIESITPEDSGWKRAGTDGDDRIAVFASALTGGLRTQALTYFNSPTSALDQVIDNYVNAIYSYGGTLTAPNLARIVALLTDLDAADLLDPMQALWLFQGNHLGSARLNAVNPTNLSGSSVITWTGSPTLNADGGITPAVGAYGMTDLHADGIGLTALSGAGLGFYGTSDASSGEYTLGNYDQFHLSPKVNPNGYVRISGADQSTGAMQDLTGFHYAAREPNGTTVKAYRNGTRYANISVAFAGTFMPTSTAKFKVGGVIEGVSQYASTTPIRLAMVTHGILEADVATLNTIIGDYVA